MDEAPGELVVSTSMICPRCGTEVAERFYGPCQACCRDLVAKFRPAGDDVDGSVVAVVEQPERVHGTPNFVATKD